VGEETQKYVKRKKTKREKFKEGLGRKRDTWTTVEKNLKKMLNRIMVKYCVNSRFK